MLHHTSHLPALHQATPQITCTGTSPCYTTQHMYRHLTKLHHTSHTPALHQATPHFSCTGTSPSYITYTGNSPSYITCTGTSPSYITCTGTSPSYTTLHNSSQRYLFSPSNSFLQLQLFAVAMWVTGDLTFLFVWLREAPSSSLQS